MGSKTAEEAIDSKCDIGSPMCLTAFLKYKSWLKTFSDCIVQKERKTKGVYAVCSNFTIWKQLILPASYHQLIT